MKNNDLNKIHTALLFMAGCLDEICKEHHINYTVDGGTMIGIIRHNGFIPWDDDMDVHMLRSDYERFIELIESNIDSRFKIVNLNNTKNYYHCHAKFLLKDSQVIQYEHKNSDEAQELFIDVFPYDNAPTNKFLQITQKWKCYVLGKAIFLRGNFIKEKNIQNTILDYLILKLMKNMTRDELINRVEKESQKYNGTETGLVAYMTGSKKGYEHTLSPKDLHEDTIYMNFEDIRLLCVRNYDYLLRLQFGDYMVIPPVENRVDHNMKLIKLPKYLEASEI